MHAWTRAPTPSAPNHTPPPQLAARLAERRIAIEKEVLRYGEAPTGIKEVFELCRGFERAYVELVNVSGAGGGGGGGGAGSCSRCSSSSSIGSEAC